MPTPIEEMLHPVKYFVCYMYRRHFVKKLAVPDTVENFGEIDGEDADIGVSR